MRAVFHRVWKLKRAMRKLGCGARLFLAAALLAGAHASARDLVGLGFTTADAGRTDHPARLELGSGSRKHAEALIAALRRRGEFHADGAIAAARMAQRDHPILPPPARLDADALERARPPYAAATARERRTLRACSSASAQPDCRYAGLQDALSAALPGDTVVLAPGVY
jgi:hypothetical protein